MVRAKRIRRDWPAILQAQTASGLSVAAFCRQHGVPRRQFYRWRQPGQAAKKSTSKRFIELRPSPESGPGLTLIAPSGWRIEVSPAFDRATLERLLSCLHRLRPCSG